MRQARSRAILVGVLAFMLCSGFVCTGSALHKVTVAQHDFKAAVTAFQDVEISEHNQGFVPDDIHRQMQATIQKVALAGVDLDKSLQAGASTPTIKGKLDAIYTLLDSLNTDGILGIKNPTTKAALEVALDGVKAIIDNALVQIS